MTTPSQVTEWTDEEIVDLLADAIDDSMDMDWTSRIGARAIMRELAQCGLQITYTAARRDLLANPPADLSERIAEEDAREEAFNGSQFGLGA